MKNKKKIPVRCWEFFHCIPMDQARCLIAETQEWRCWKVDVACCRIDKDAPRPLSLKKKICPTCEYYKAFSIL